MHHDEPTLPNLRGYDAEGPGGMPAWPGAHEHPRRAARRDRHTTLLGASLGANVALLIGLVGLFVLGRAGFFASGGSAASLPPGAVASSTALGSPSTTGSPTPPAGWLQVAPSSVRLGCDNGQATQFAVLVNQGPEQVQWQAQFSLPGDQAGVSLSPTQGQLRAGTSIVLHLNNKRQGAGQQGVIRFALTSPTPDAGSLPSLSYTTMGCD